MDLVKISERIYQFPFIDELDRPSLFYIKGDSSSVAIDAGQSESHVNEFYEALKSKGLPLPEYTILTHWHWDHSFAIPFVHGKTIATKLANKQLEVVKQWKWTREDMYQRVKDKVEIPIVNKFILKVFPDLSKIKVETADIEIEENMELDLGGVHINLYPRDSIHTRDSIIIFCPEEKSIFAGDADCPDFYNNREISPQRVQDYKTFLSNIEFDTYYLAHDLPDSKEAILKRLDEM